MVEREEGRGGATLAMCEGEIKRTVEMKAMRPKGVAHFRANNMFIIM